MSTAAPRRDAARLMDAIYGSQRHIYDLTRKYYLLGRDQTIDGLDVPSEGSVLEIGCGTARNLVRVARRYPDATCYGLDVSVVMLATAERNVSRAGLSGRIRLAQGDATTVDASDLLGRGEFDRVLISYALSMIPPWREVLARASLLVAPGGSLHVVDFGDQSGLPRGFKVVLEAWLARFHVTPRATLAEEIGRVARDRGFSASSWTSHRGYALSARIARSL